jgi:predicted outer membrane lipoprotein
MWIKIIVLLAMAGVLFSLFTALYYLVKGQGDSQKTLKFLIWRLGISIAIFLGLYLASFFGIIAPHGLPQVQDKPAATEAAPR